MSNKYSAKFKIPENFEKVLGGFSKEVLRCQPKDVNSFAYTYFTKLALEVEKMEKKNEEAE